MLNLSSSTLLTGALLTLSLALAACGDDTGTGANGGGGSPSTGGNGGEAEGGSPSNGGGGQGEGGESEGGGGASSCELVTADAYDGAAFDTNGAMELTLRAQLGTLNSAMSAAEADLAVVPTVAELTELYEAGDPSLRDVTSTYYQDRILAIFGQFEAAAGNEWAPSAPPVGSGGKYGNYIFSAEGTDLRQGVEKGLFHAAFFNHAWSLRAATFDAAALDRLLAAYGADPTFPGTSDAAESDVPDRIGAQYTERRSPKDPNDSSLPLDPAAPGPYFRIKTAFLRAQAAIAAGEACDAELQTELDAIYSDWERAMLGTVVYYLNDAYTKLTIDNPTVTQLAGGLHGYGEAIGFIHGFKGIPEDARTITDDEIDELLTDLGAPAEGDITSFELLTDSAAAAPRLLDGIEKIGEIYGFSAQELDAFETNH